MARQRKRLGDMLVEAGLLSTEELTAALRGQRGSGLMLGDYLIRHDIVSEDEIIDLLSEQLQIKKFQDGEFEISPGLAQLIPNDIANKYKAIPLAKDDFVMTVATPDPMNVEALDFIEKYCDIELEPLICSNNQFKLLSNGIYGITSEVDDILGDIETDDEDAERREEEQNKNLQDAAEDAPVIRLVNSILRQAVTERASDIHISPERNYAQVRLRIDGDLHEIPPPPKSTLAGIISRIKILAKMDITSTRVPQDGRFTIHLNEQEISIRVSTIPTIYGENMVMRLLFVTAGAIPLEELGLLDDDFKALLRLAAKPYGMILSAGPTGSGKSSTLYAILRKVISPKINVITLEDPVEYRMAGARQVQLNTKANMTFASGLRSILRQDPDVIMVGEIRDNETAGIATQAALTGHLVLSTLHTNDAASSITRLVNMGIEPFLISAALLGICAQRLLKRNCPHCSEDYQPSEAVRRYWGLGDTDTGFKKSKGCTYCMQSGYRGRMGIYEILTVDDAVREMILGNITAADMTRRLHKAGKLKLLREMALLRVREGLTTFAEAAKTVMV